MKRFRFRLERVLRLRRAEHRQKTAQLAETMRSRNDKQRDLDVALDTHLDMQRSYRQSATERTTAMTLAGARHAVTATRRSIHERVRHLRDAETVVEKARQSLLATLRELETLQRLRQKRRDEHLHGENRLEQAQFDELAGQRHRRQNLTEDN